MLQKLRNRLIVSCQAQPDEPLHSAFIMSRMALAAQMGGAGGIRAESISDILKIMARSKLPVIGLIKKTYPDSPVYITPTLTEVDALLNTYCPIIALDMTDRPRPAKSGGLKRMIRTIHNAGRLVLADISTCEEGIAAAALGADAVSTTLSGYTPYSRHLEGPDVELVRELTTQVSIPVFAEGRISTPEQIKLVMDAGAWAPIVGSAITRPQLITAKFAAALAKTGIVRIKDDFLYRFFNFAGFCRVCRTDGRETAAYPAGFTVDGSLVRPGGADASGHVPERNFAGRRHETGQRYDRRHLWRHVCPGHHEDRYLCQHH